MKEGCDFRGRGRFGGVPWEWYHMRGSFVHCAITGGKWKEVELGKWQFLTFDLEVTLHDLMLQKWCYIFARHHPQSPPQSPQVLPDSDLWLDHILLPLEWLSCSACYGRSHAFARKLWKNKTWNQQPSYNLSLESLLAFLQKCRGMVLK